MKIMTKKEFVETFYSSFAKNVLKEKLNCKKKMSIREAVFAEHEEIAALDAIGRICASPTVSCPPAIPIVISGEVITKHEICLLKHYGIQEVEVVKE